MQQPPFMHHQPQRPMPMRPMHPPMTPFHRQEPFVPPAFHGRLEPPMQARPRYNQFKYAFTNPNGEFDVQKTMQTIDTAMKTYHQVSPLLRMLPSLFSPGR
ncbi:YppG-like protein [Salsuginibacillus halophilus]|uniref:YppG-like protein n=1 Tax=Salsuginibacillus halophilus TaxID=517424 RepID=A0A2P8HYP6_9BACI|nr:YppG family protein [Salsuginibacillus halophilus]PSL51340.1 YppG-like protein [Salsuginibacillus halophilus]